MYVLVNRSYLHVRKTFLNKLIIPTQGKDVIMVVMSVL